MSVDETLHQNFQNLLQLASGPWEGCNLQAIYIETVYFTDNAGGAAPTDSPPQILFEEGGGNSKIQLVVYYQCCILIG